MAKKSAKKTARKAVKKTARKAVKKVSKKVLRTLTRDEKNQLRKKIQVDLRGEKDPVKRTALRREAAVLLKY